MSWLEQLLTKPPEYLYALAVLVGVATVAGLVYLLIKLVKGRNGSDTMSTALAWDQRLDKLEMEMVEVKTTLLNSQPITAELKMTVDRLSRELGILTGILQEHTRRMNGSG